MKKYKVIHFVAKGILTALMLFSISMYLFNNEVIQQAFISFGYPTYLIYPLAAAKFLGLIAIWQTKFIKLQEWAYAGFFFNIVLAFFAHVMISDGEQLFALIGFNLVLAAYFTKNK